MRRSSALLLACLSASLVLVAAAPPPFTFPRSAPEAQGISSAAILGFVEDAERKLDALHSLMIVRHGKVVAEGWWAPYAASEPHTMFSLSKSFTSTAVGLAIAEGKLTIDDPVLGFFPDDAPAQPSANLKAMRIRDLLTMSAGHHDEDVRDFPYTGDDSVVKAFLARPVAHKPGTFFFYNTPASYMLSAIVQKVTGQTVLTYLGPRLFEPLGIENPTWDASKQGVSLGGFGLHVRTEDIARFGQLYLQKGQWQGKQLVPEAWVAAATSRMMSNGSSPTSDWEQGYGYQFWQSRHGFRGDGAHGQFCLVLPQYDAVIAITSGTRDMASVMNLVWERLLPAFKPAALPPDAASARKLADKLAVLKLKAPSGTATTTAGRTAQGKRFVFDSNKLALESLTVQSSNAGGDAVLALRLAGADQKLAAGYQRWAKGALQLTAAGAPEPVAASGAWTADDTYTMTVARYRTPFTTLYQLRFTGDQLFLKIEQNVGAAETRVTELTGQAEGRRQKAEGRN
jgi:CubicO group peptidase (beta-lactamase class C family)